MPRDTSPAVFTSLGLLTPIGNDPASFWSAMLHGTPGIRRIRSFDPSSLACQIAGEIDDFDAKKILVEKEQKKAVRVMARTVQLGVAAAHLAMAAGGPAVGQIDPNRFGVEFGCVMVATELEDLARGAKISTNGVPGQVDLAAWGGQGLRQVPPLWMLKYLPNMPACHVSIFHDARGPNNTITSSDAASLLALGEAYRILDRGLADAFIVGGCDSKVNPLSMSRYNTFVKLSRRNHDPAHALRPFDAERDGTVIGEGAAVVTLETADFARQRGARILAELCGFASGYDRDRTGSVLARVIRQALAEAGISPADVDHVNAGAGGFIDLDAFEARAIHEVFGDATPVFALRGQVGAMGAASGLVELAASILALQHGQLPGTVNFTMPDPACPVAVHSGSPRPVRKPYAVKISYTDKGQCAVVVVRKPRERAG